MQEESDRHAAAEILSGADVARLGRALGAGRHGDRDELMAQAAAYGGLRWGELAALTVPQVRGEVGVLGGEVGEAAGEVAFFVGGGVVGAVRGGGCGFAGAAREQGRDSEVEVGSGGRRRPVRCAGGRAPGGR
jgi:hypothetical protein